MKNKIIDITKNIRGRIIPRNRKYKNVFSTDEGQYVLAELYKFCGIDRPSYVEGCSDRTAYNEGMKRVASHIKGILNQKDIDVDKLVEDYNKSINYDPFKQ